jgi:hypothetical protein
LSAVIEEGMMNERNTGGWDEELGELVEFLGVP